jgi:hypothetical protein
LGIDLDRSRQIERQIGLGCEVIKPGWVRVNFNYFISEEEFQFIVEGVRLIAEHGWRLLPHYRFEAETALWRHRRGLPHPPLSLFEIDYGNGHLEYRTSERVSAGAGEYPRYVAEAHTFFATASTESDVTDDILAAEAESLRWFPLPHEVGV